MTLKAKDTLLYSESITINALIFLAKMLWGIW